MRFLRVLLTVVVILPMATGEARADESVVMFEGHGWGHGVGMSQYGAEAMAELDGWTGEQIVEYYYTDANVTPLAGAVPNWLVSDPEPLWINLTGSPSTTAQQVSLKATAGGLTLCQQEPDSLGTMSQANNGGVFSPYVKILQQELFDRGHDPQGIDGYFGPLTEAAVIDFQNANSLPANGEVDEATKNVLWPPDSGDRCFIETPLTTSAVKLTPNQDGTECTFGSAVAAGACLGSVRGLTPSTRLVIPERKIRNGSAIELAHGNLRIRPDFDSSSGSFEGIHVLLEIGVDDYIYGIDEIIYAWSSVANEALRAQAIASRAYAIGNAAARGPEAGFSASRKDSCWCHLWSTTFSQVYAGYYPETVSGGVWKAASDSTAGMILVHPTAGIVTAFFSSSNGGKSEANEAIWGGSPVPYLRSVDDPWSLDTSGAFPNPFANWTTSVSASTVAAKVGFDTLIDVAVIATNQSGSAKTVRFTGLEGGVEKIVDKTGTWVRTQFGLRSNYFSVGLGGSEPPPGDEATFDDIVGHTFEADIEWAYANGLTKGCNPPANNLFCPNDPVTRGQMAAFIDRFLDLPEATKDYFSDDNGSIFEAHINRLAEAGITKGCGNGLFCPNSYVTRGQMAAFLVRAFGLTANSHQGFDDVPSTHTFYTDIGKLATAGITKGCNPPDNNRYCPDSPVTRGQMTAFLHRASKA